MKPAILFLLVFPLTSFCQISGFVGTSVNSSKESQIFLQVEDQTKWAKIQLTYLTDLRLGQQKLNAKLMVRPYRSRTFQVWISCIPYLNMNLKEGGKYNTPINLEVNFKNWIFGMDTNFRQLQFQVRFREKLFSKNLDSYLDN